MNIITLDGKTFSVKYVQKSETINTNFKTSSFDYPDFEGSKNYHNGTGSREFSLTFAIHQTQLTDLTKSLGKIYDPDNIISKKPYGNLERIIIEHEFWGAIYGNIIGKLVSKPSGEGDVYCSCVFKEHTPDAPLEKKDIEDENTDANDDIDSETSIFISESAKLAASNTTGSVVSFSTQDKSLLGNLADSLTSLYSSIQNSSVVSAFNDLNTFLNATTVDSLSVMNAFKKILSLPNEILPDTRSKIEMLTYQATAIKDIPISSYNMALFNANLLSYNVGITSKTPFVSESATEAAAGISTVSLT